MIYTKGFWIDASERAIATFAQVVLSIVTVMFPVAVASEKQDLEVLVSSVTAALPLILITGLGGALFSVLKSVVAAYKAGTDTASLVKK